MTKLFIEESSLTDIGDAIREKTGDTELLSPSGMVDAIRGLIVTDTEVPDEAFVIKDYEGRYLFAGGNWNWFFDTYKHSITTENLCSGQYMFYQFTPVSFQPFEIPFDFNCGGTAFQTYNMFDTCYVSAMGDFYNLVLYGDIYRMFAGCRYLRNLPNFVNCSISNSGIKNCSYMFIGCYSLRSIPENFLEIIRSTVYSGIDYQVFYGGFSNCHSLDEIRGLNPQTEQVIQNMFSDTFTSCNRLKNIVFATQEDGTPYSVNWSSQTIDLRGVGFISPLSASLDGSDAYILNYNSGITADKKVTDAASYAALKDDPDWYTTKAYYCRFNHDSMVNMINTLPDVSAGTGNTIKGYTAQGAYTDGGGIGDLAAEEIAVAAAKGWTISLTNHSWFPYEPTTT